MIGDLEKGVSQVGLGGGGWEDSNPPPAACKHGQDVQVCGLRSGAAVRQDTELVPLGVGKHDPALIACLADVGVPGA